MNSWQAYQPFMTPPSQLWAAKLGSAPKPDADPLSPACPLELPRAERISTGMYLIGEFMVARQWVNFSFRGRHSAPGAEMWRVYGPDGAPQVTVPRLVDARRWVAVEALVRDPPTPKVDSAANAWAAAERIARVASHLLVGMVLGVVLFFVWLTSANAADKPDDKYKVRDRNGRVESVITPDPNVDGRLKVRDRYGRVQGTIDSDGEARDRVGRPVPLTDLIKPDNKK